MTPHAFDKPPGGWLEDPEPFLLEYISEIVDVLWLVRPSPSPDTSPEVVPQMFNWRQVWPWKSRDSAKLHVILDDTCTMGSSIVVLKDECIPMPSDVGHNNRLNDIVSVAQASDIPLADMEFCSPSHGDPSPNHDLSLIHI